MGLFQSHKGVFDKNTLLKGTFRNALLATRNSHHGQKDLNKILGTLKGTHQTSKWTPLGTKITEN